MNYYTLFRTINMVNGKSYYGVHKTQDLFFGTPDSNDPYVGDTKDINADLSKYGRAVFLVEAIHAYADLESAQRFLKKYTEKPGKNSYNIPELPHGNIGNTNPNGSVRSQAFKDNLSRLYKGESNNFYGEKHSEETIKLMSEFRMQTIWINDGFSERQILKTDSIPDGWERGRKKPMTRRAKLNEKTA